MPQIVDTRRSQPEAATDFVRHAESLIRSLAGVIHARISVTPTGIDAIHVLAADDRAAADMAGHVRSALLAGLATPVVPARIHVRTSGEAPEPRDDDDHADDDTIDATDPAPPRDRLRLLHDDALDIDPDDAAHGRMEAATALVDAPAADPPRHTDRVRLIAVDVRKPGDGRVVCRVSVAWDARVHRAEAVAMDLPGAAAQAAAQAAVRALVGAGLDTLELNGLRELEIAGRDYVLVALRRHDGPAVRHRSGSALMFGSPERSAAEAAVDAANELL